MSYILDALKKSEAERNLNSGMSLLSYPSQKQIAGVPIWLIVIVTVVVNISAMVVWTYWPSTKARQTPKLLLQDTAKPVQRDTGLIAPTIRKAVKKTEVELPVKPQPVQDYPNPIIPFAALSKTERDTFPQVKFSTHVYSDDPEFRVLVANGLRLTEGEMLSGRVKLITINENGAVFLHANRLVEIPVLQDWRIE